MIPTSCFVSAPKQPQEAPARAAEERPRPVSNCLPLPGTLLPCRRRSVAPTVQAENPALALTATVVGSPDLSPLQSLLQASRSPLFRRTSNFNHATSIIRITIAKSIHHQSSPKECLAHVLGEYNGHIYPRLDPDYPSKPEPTTLKSQHASDSSLRHSRPLPPSSSEIYARRTRNRPTTNPPAS